MAGWSGGTPPRVLFDMAVGPMPRGVLGLGDPDVGLVDGRWTLLLGGFSTGFRNRLYSACAPQPGGPWRVVTDRRGRARPLVPDPPRDGWDAGGLHTPALVAPHAGNAARIYYAGRTTRAMFGAGSHYAIGVLERRDGRWRRRPAPVLMCTDSANGIDGWSSPVVAARGFFDNAVVFDGRRWVMVLARGGNFHGTRPYPAQGLWWCTAGEPHPMLAQWSPLRRLLDADVPDTPDWAGRGTYGPGLAFGPDGRATILFSAIRSGPRWPQPAARNLACRRRPPFPAPFHLSVASMEWQPG